MKRKLLLILLAAALLYGGFWLYSWYKAQPVAYEFIGRIQKMENGVLFANGTYTVQGRSDLSGPDTKTDVRITLAKDAKFVKEFVYLPTAKELEKTGGMYRASDLKREKTDGSADDLAWLLDSGAAARFLSDGNIYKKSKFKVSTLEYIKAIYPE